jgi:transcriptional regulator with XRE-family HTH domain
MEISDQLTDTTILTELGDRIGHRRLDLQMTQVELAEQAGVSKRTIERIEAGASAQTSNLVRIFRVLGLLPNLDRMIPATGPRPMDLLRRKGKRRQRASTRRAEQNADEPWSWGEDA